MSEEEKKKILVIDDEENFVENVCKVFKRRGFTTFGTTDGEDGLRLFRKANPDITLIDIYLPDSSLSGAGVFKKIKEDNPKALCVMLTFLGGQAIVDECKALGATNFVRKIDELEALTQTIEDILKDSPEESGD